MPLKYVPLLRYFRFLGALLFPVGSWAQCPVTAACVPGAAPATNALFGMGIYRVQLANLDTTTNGSLDGYRDYSCLRRATLLQGSTYTLRVQTGASAAENALAWLDYNNDGAFTPNERILYSLNAFTHMASFTVPGAATLNQSLRLRIAADYANAPVPTACSTPQYSQTEDYPVRIAAGTARPVARFITPDTITCNSTVTFHDVSLNVPTTWLWQLGDGRTSTAQHPVHTYTNPGTYSIKLRVCNAGGCDSLTRINYVTVRTDGPRVSNCQPATTAYCCNFGITRVRLAGLDHSSADGQAGYEDFSCAFRTTLTADNPATLQLTTGPNAHDVRVYLDLNDDGQFTSSTELLYQGLGVQSPSIPLTVASSLNPVYNRPLRLRIVADYAGSPATGPCSNLQSGQAEDYTVTLLPNTTRPSAAFTLQYQRLCGPVQVTVANTTTGGATSYTWDFGDGTTSTQTSPPLHTYSAAGVYEIRLIAQSAFGRDTARQAVAVATACPTYCLPSPTGGSSFQPAYITRLQLANLNNTSPRGPGVGYRDFTAQVITVQPGQSYSLRTESLPWNFAGNGPWITVEAWIDSNQDGQFDFSELSGPVSQLSPQQLTIRIPASAKVGATRLRVVVKQLNQSIYADACLPNGLTASVEDYTVLVQPARIAPTTGFFADLTTTCNSLVQFRDTSWAGPTSWAWTFGDGGTSSLQHPQHAYAAPGTYTVALRAGNSYGSQLLTRSNYVTVGALATGPRPASCRPSFGNTVGQRGIDTLRIGTFFFYHQPWNAIGYRDETCTLAPIALASGTAYPLRFVDANPSGTSFFAWVDANDDGVFDSSSELVFNSLQTVPQPRRIVGSLSVPGSTLLNRPLRMRVMQWGAALNNPRTTVPDPCIRQDYNGQVRDFTVVVTNPLAIRPTSAPTRWTLLPNPTKGEFTIAGNFTGPVLVEAWDLLGRRVYQRTSSTNSATPLMVDFQHLPRGVYIVQVNSSGPMRLTLE